MKIVRATDKYKIVDLTGDSIYDGEYQIWEWSAEDKEWETCGIYFTRKDAIDDFHKLNKIGEWYSNSPRGFGPTEDAALADLIDQLEEV